MGRGWGWGQGLDGSQKDHPTLTNKLESGVGNNGRDSNSRIPILCVPTHPPCSMETT